MRFRADLLGHTESIQLLLTTLHMKNSNLDRKSQQGVSKTIASQVQHGFSNCMSRLSAISGTIYTISAHTQCCVESCRKIISMNVRIFQAVLDIQQILTTIPGQIERQQPVYLTDLWGRVAPFHLEFIQSAEALFSVLSVNFKEIGYASVKVMNKQCIFYTRDACLDLRFPWENMFKPGKRVHMALIFYKSEIYRTACPRCSWPCESPVLDVIEWSVLAIKLRKSIQ